VDGGGVDICITGVDGDGDGVDCNDDADISGEFLLNFGGEGDLLDKLDGKADEKAVGVPSLLSFSLTLLDYF
jgi:hypothetical protein